MCRKEVTLVKKIADAVLVAMMLMASVPGLAEDTAALLPQPAIEETLSLPAPQDEA